MLGVDAKGEYELRGGKAPHVGPVGDNKSPVKMERPPVLRVVGVGGVVVYPFLFLRRFVLVAKHAVDVLTPIMPVRLTEEIPDTDEPALAQKRPTGSPSVMVLPSARGEPGGEVVGMEWSFAVRSEAISTIFPTPWAGTGKAAVEVVRGTAADN